MELATWGLLGVETNGEERRTRTLGLGKTVRFFNEKAVPGLGGVWFGKELFLATLGVQVAERVLQLGKLVQNIEVANSIEAMACWLALNDKQQRWQRDPRVRGAMKMKGKTDLSFAKVRKPSFYVTQPMRQQTVQPLLELGFVESSGERFNSFECTEVGREFIRLGSEEIKQSGTIKAVESLVKWVLDPKNEGSDLIKPKLKSILSPLQPLPEVARMFIRERLATGGDGNGLRRRKAMDWVEQLYRNPPGEVTWNQQPRELDADHWEDLQAGGLFFAARAAAIALLDAIEKELATNTKTKLLLGDTLPDAVIIKSKVLTSAAKTFLVRKHDQSPGGSATVFCCECIEQDHSAVIRRLVARDGRVLRMQGQSVVPGTAFDAKQASSRSSTRSIEDDGQEIEVEQKIALPPGISNRIRNAYLLNIDLHGEMNEWLYRDGTTAEVNHDEG